MLVDIVVFEMGWVNVSVNFREKRGLSTNDCGRQKRVRGLSRGVVCMILSFAVLTQYQRVSDGQTDRHTMMAKTALA